MSTAPVSAPRSRASVVEEEVIACLPHLRAFARSLTGDRDRADDLVQDAVLRALGAAEQFTPGTNFKAWIFTILRNLYFNEFRRNPSLFRPLEAADMEMHATSPAQQAGLELSRLKLARGLAINNAFDGRFDVALRTIDWIIAELKRLEADQLGDVYVSALWIRDNVLYFQDDLDAAYASAQQTVALARRVPNRTVTSGAASTLAQIQFLRAFVIRLMEPDMFDA